MKRLLILSLTIFIAILLISSCSNEESQKITVEYIANEGGSIVGEAIQEKELSNKEAVQFSGVEAVANQGYRFKGWSDGNIDAKRTDTLQQSSKLYAIFEKIEYVLVTYKANDNGKIFGTVSQEIEKGQSTTQVEAVANVGYHFVSWSDGVTEAKRTDVASANVELFATFEQNGYATITYLCTQGGTIEGITEQRLLIGQSTTEVIPIASNGYDFIGWDDGINTDKRTDVASKSRTITAIFAKQEATIEYRATEGGSISGETIQIVKRGQSTQRVSARAQTGYVFVGWDDGAKGSIRSDNATEDVVYTAIFKRSCTIDFVCFKSYGKIEGKASQNVALGEKTSMVKAIPNEGYTFLGWSNGVTTPEIEFVASANLEMTAYFAPNSTGLPVVSIATEGSAPVDSKDYYVNCVVSLLDTETNESIIGESAKIKGRGNSTWDKFDKKPYKIKFNSKQNIFDFGKGKDWVLLADYIDGSLVRNMLAYDVARLFSELGSTPNCQSVEVYLNGDYRGVYLLCEQVEVNNNRVEISEDASLVDTGYLVEMDGWSDKVQVSVPDHLNSSRKYTIKSPDSEVITKEQKEFIQAYLKDCMKAIQGTDYERVKELLDVKSFAQAYIVFELFKNPDVNYSSVYFYKDAGGKLVCGPVWDFDMSIGNVNHKGGGVFESTKTLWTKETCPWFNSLLEFEEFRLLVGSELVEYKDLIVSTLESKYEYIYAHEYAYCQNFKKWDVLGKNTWTNPSYIVKINTWQGQVNYTRSYLLASLEYLLEYYPPKA